jgi:hypothetical protein
MPYNIYDLGDLVKVSATFKDAGTGGVIDPDVINVSIKTPAGLLTTYTHIVDASLIKEGVGQYYAMVNANEPGFWKYRWWSAGYGQTAKEKEFKVRTAEAVEAPGGS